MMIAEVLKNNNQLTDFITAQSSVAIVLVDEQQKISDCNNGFLKLFSLLEKPKDASISNFLIPGIEGIVFAPGDQQFTCNPKTGVHGVLIAHRLPYNNGMLLWCERLLNTNNQVVEQIGLLNNEFIALQRELDKKNHFLNLVQHELEEKIVQLESALSQVKQLEGIIPICMYCKKIRDEEQLWHQLEQYISEHSDAMFSHGICPVCFEEHYSAEKNR
jgi:hypothetical protein